VIIGAKAAMAFWLAFFAALSGRCQLPRFDRFLVEDGLPQNTVAAILQDDRGFLWLGTQGGLARYDGYGFRNYYHDPEDPASLSDARIACLFQDSRGRLWVGTLAGLNLYRPQADRFARYLPGDVPGGAPAAYVAAMAELPGGELLLADWNSGLIRFDPETGAATPLEAPGAPERRLRSLLIDSAGRIWLGSGQGLYRSDDGGRHFIHCDAAAGAPRWFQKTLVRTLYEDRAGRIWAGGRRGLVRWEPEWNRFVAYRLEPEADHGLTGRDIMALAEDGEGRLWAAGNGGLFRYEVERDRFVGFGPEDGLSDRVAIALHRDRTGLLWIGARVGLNRCNPGVERFGLIRYDGAANLVWGFAEDAAGRLWVATSAGLLRHDSARFDPRAEPDARYRARPGDAAALKDDQVNGLLVDREDRLWIATNGGVNRYLPERDAFKAYPAPNRAWTFCETRSGQLWMGNSKGVHAYLPEADAFEQVPAEDIAARVGGAYTILEDRHGGLWLGGQGLARRSPDGDGAWFAADADDPASLVADQVAALYEDAHGRLWVGAYGGLSRYLGEGRFKSYRRRDGLPDEAVNGILADERGDLWLSLNNGLCRFDPDAETFRKYDVADGLQGAEYIAKSCYRARDGRFFFGGVNGYNRFDPAAIADDPHAPAIALTGFQALDAGSQGAYVEAWDPGVEFAEEVSLRHTQRVFMVRFAALHFAAPERNRYAYKLEGFDADWRHVGADQRVAAYTNLDAGEYRFRIKAANKDGVWAERSSPLRIDIAPPPWRTAPAYAAYAALAALLAWSLWRRQRRAFERQRRRNRELDRQVAERTAALRAKTREALDQQAQLQRQADQLENQALRLAELDAVKTRFFTNISHEFRTPLTLIAAPLNDLLTGKDGPLAAAAVDHVRLALQSANKLRDLIDQLLDLAKLDAGAAAPQRRCGDLARFVRLQTECFHALAARRKIALEYRGAARLDACFDPDMLEKMLGNLLSNGFKHTAAGGRVAVTLTRRGDEARIEVSDDGAGIEPERLDRVFDRFHSSGGEGASSGIGLALARELARLHGGDIEAESEPGAGSRFTLCLPLEANFALSPAAETPAPATLRLRSEPPMAESDASSDEPAEAEAQPRDRAAVLAIEDHAEARAYLAERLRPHYRVWTAAAGDAGLRLARERLPDLIVSDVMMPGLDGLALCRELKADPCTSHIPVLLLTAKAAEVDKLAGLEEGADAYLVKPFDTDELLLRLRNLLAARRVWRERFTAEALLSAEPEGAISQDEAFFRKLREAMDRLMAESRCSVADLASEMGFSRRQLHRKLTALTGRAPGEVMRAFRLERAKRLLAARTGGIAQVAYAAGFKTARQFTAAFREAHGCTPSEFMAREGASSAAADPFVQE